MSDIENQKENSKGRGGAREGAGRPKGSMNETTKEKMAVKAAFIDRINKNADKLFNSQLDVALGEKYLMVKRTEGEGKNRKVWHEIVEDTKLIIDFLDGNSDDDDGHYYYMTTKPANNMAIDSLLNRSFGKATEKVELEHSGEVATGIANPKLAVEFAQFLKDKNA